MKRRGMEAVASKSVRRTPVFLRKKQAEDMKDMPRPPKPEMDDEEDDDAPLTCPKCGMQLADNDENRAYVKMRDEESEESDEDED